MSDDTNLSNFLAMLRRQRVLVIAAGVLAAVAALLVSSLQQTQYTSSARLLYSAASTPAGVANEDPARALDTLVGLAKNPAVLEAAATSAGVSVERLDGATSVSGDPNADLMSITATGRSAGGASAMANALAKSFVRWRTNFQKALVRARITSLQTQIAHLTGRGSPAAAAVVSDLRLQLAEARSELAVPSADVTLIKPAVAPQHPSAPHPLRNGAIGLVAGLLIGLFGASVRDRLDRRLRSVEEVEAAYDCPCLGVIPFVPDARRGLRHAAIGDFRANSPLAGSFRAARTNLTLLIDDVKTVIVTSAVAGEGKTTVTANIARAFAATGNSVLAVSADVESPALHTYFGSESSIIEAMRLDPDLTALPKRRAAGSRGSPRRSLNDEQVGLIEVLAGEVPLATAVRRYPVVGPLDRVGEVAVLANARRFFDPAPFYQSEAMSRFLEQVREEYDIVLIDAPPILRSAESALLSMAADGVVLVARLGVLTRKQADRAARVMASVRVAPRGVIVTGHAEDEFEYGYGDGDSRTSLYAQLSQRLSAITRSELLERVRAARRSLPDAVRKPPKVRSTPPKPPRKPPKARSKPTRPRS